MDNKFYFDACIWIDYFENRFDKFRPLGDFALELIKKIIEEGNCFIVSDHVIEELEKKYSKEERGKIFEIIPEQLIIKINSNEKQVKEAFKIKNKFKIPFGDALHAVLARDNKAVLVTRDKHFYELGDNVRKPEELI